MACYRRRPCLGFVAVGLSRSRVSAPRPDTNPRRHADRVLRLPRFRRCPGSHCRCAAERGSEGREGLTNSWRLASSLGSGHFGRILVLGLAEKVCFTSKALV